MTSTEATDEHLLADAAAGDSNAFGELFDRHANAVYNHCFRLAASWSVAEDATQATFLTAWRKRARARIVDGSLRPWLLSVATNTVRDEQRSARRWLAALRRLPPDRDSGTHVEDQVTDRLDSEQLMRRVLRATQRLSRAEREVLALCVWSSVSYTDAAALLGITEGSVRARVSRARARLSQALQPAQVTQRTTNVKEAS